MLHSRLVCNTWNDVAIKFYASSFVVQLINENSATALTEFIQFASESPFFGAISAYRLSKIESYSEAERGVWETFFERFGENIKSLTLSDLHRDVVKVISADDIQKFLGSVTTFHLKVSLSIPLVASAKFCFLRQLKHLTIAATGESSEYGQIEFLSKLVKLDHRLESLTLHGHYCTGQLPKDILPNVFRTGTIESLEVAKHPAPFMVDAHFRSITTKPAVSKLKAIKFDFTHNNVTPTPIVFHQFLVAHRHTLQKISIPRMDYLEHFPALHCLTHLESNIDNSTRKDGLSFCAQFPNLAVLKLNVPDGFFIGRWTAFEHTALQSLHVESSDTSIVSILPDILSNFPNLRKLELRHNSSGTVPLRNVGRLRHQIRYVCERAGVINGSIFTFFLIISYREPGKSVWT